MAGVGAGLLLPPDTGDSPHLLVLPDTPSHGVLYHHSRMRKGFRHPCPRRAGKQPTARPLVNFRPSCKCAWFCFTANSSSPQASTSMGGRSKSFQLSNSPQAHKLLPLKGTVSCSQAFTSQGHSYMFTSFYLSNAQFHVHTLLLLKAQFHVHTFLPLKGTISCSHAFTSQGHNFMFTRFYLSMAVLVQSVYFLAHVHKFFPLRAHSQVPLLLPSKVHFSSSLSDTPLLLF